jgi:hypothetical protein
MIQLRAYPPAGRRISLAPFFNVRRRRPLALPPDVGSAIPFRSGSECLFQILCGVQPNIPMRARRVALPAYSCPSILGAALGAGFEPHFVDLAPDTFSLDINSLQRALDVGVSAVVSVDLFGVPSQSSQIREMCGKAQALFIRDMAQCRADDVASRPMDADAGVLSFGRGKPTSVLFGGAVLLPNDSMASTAISTAARSTTYSEYRLALRALAYNLATRPVPYGLMRRLPWLHVGESTLEITSQATRLPTAFLSLVGAQCSDAHRSMDGRRGANLAMVDLLEASGLRVPHAVRRGVETVGLNRIPALAPSPAVAGRLSIRCGVFGVTRMYHQLLPEFNGTSESEAAHCWPNAFSLSRHLLTFPASGRLPVQAHRALAGCLRRPDTHGES